MALSTLTGRIPGCGRLIATEIVGRAVAFGRVEQAPRRATGDAVETGAVQVSPQISNANDGGDMQISSRTKPLVFTEDDHEMRVQYSNRGEPYREGVEFVFDNPGTSRVCPIWVLLEHHEVEQLRDKLNEFLGAN